MNADQSLTARTGAPPAPKTQLERGYQLLREQRFQDALAHADALADRHPADPAALVLAAEACFARADLEGALARTDQAIAASGGDPVLKVRKARLLSQMRRRAEIPALADEIAAQAAGHGALLWEVGGLYHRNYLQPQAIARFEQARALLGDHPGLLYDLATARFFSGDFEQAERDLDRMLELAP